MAVEHPGVVDEHVYVAQPLDHRRDAVEILQVVAHALRRRRKVADGKVLVQRVHAPARVEEQPRRGQADAAAGTGNEDRLQAVRPGIEKPMALRSLISSSSCAAVSSTSGGRQVFHCGSLPKWATALFSAGIIGCFCTTLRVAVMPACSLSASAERQFL